MDHRTRVSTGDTGPWIRHLPDAWRAIADPSGGLPVPDRPRSDDGPDALDDRIAWWAPLLQVAMFGCGWSRPDLGLARWLRAGRPTDDPRLALIDRWWGGAVEEVLGWVAVSPHVVPRLVERVGAVTGTGPTDQPLPDDWAHVRARPGWQLTWTGGTDPMHLVDHVVVPVRGATAPGRLVVGEPPTSASPGRAVLLTDGYEGWYATLSEKAAALPADDRDRSWRVDVVCRPLGWLGTYRRSRLTGRWFAGRHRRHELGAPEAGGAV